MTEFNLSEVINRSQVYDGNMSAIKDLLNKANKGGSYKIAFIGGSITQGCHATTSEKQYTHRVFNWFKETFSKSSFEFINAPVGATGSQFGNARIQKQILQYQPDFLLVEFAVNDWGDDFHKETYEGLIRTILTSKKVPAVLGLMNVIINDNGDNAQKQHLEILKNYEIPAVSMKESFYTEIKEGRIASEEYSADRIHPTDFGHEMVAKVISSFLERINNSDISIKINNNIGEAITKNRYQNALWLQNMNFKPALSGFLEDNRKPEYDGDYFVDGWQSTENGAEISFSMNIKALAIQYRRCVIGPVPKAEVIIDGDISKKVILDGKFDETWGDCLALTNIFVEDTPKMHDIVLKVFDADGDCKPFYTVSFIAYK